MMRGYGQLTPDKPCTPDEKTRRLRAQLELEEVLEFVRDSGFDVVALAYCGDPRDSHITLGGFCPGEPTKLGDYTLVSVRECDPVGVVDGLADISVVNTGSAVAFGVDLEPILEIVDNNNLLKIKTGKRDPATGKFIKHPNHPSPAPEIAAELRRQSSR
jgi:predicted HAD superfamily Cof-like phosphohydrolase